MPNRDIVVMGASAGGVDALLKIVAKLLADLPAAVFVVVHVPANFDSLLPQILSRAGPLPVMHAVDGMRIEAGHIYVAPPDHHLLLERGRMRVVRGPRENRSRPAVDPLFRSDGLTYGPRVIGVMLSGMLDDGTSGLLTVEQRSGLCVVQDPQDAKHSGMPRSALAYVDVDYCIPAADIGPLLAQLVGEPVEEEGEPMSEELDSMVEAVQGNVSPDEMRATFGPPSILTCPECHGALWEINEDGHYVYRCHVGHAFTAENLLVEQADGLERALWAALRALEENASLNRRLAERSSRQGLEVVAGRFQERAQETEAHATNLRAALRATKAPKLDEVEQAFTLDS